jgi:PncC family amidohydrolase
MSLSRAARRVARLLQTGAAKVVLAESCTGGLVSASLTKIPGISDYHCGGVVVYRNATKTAYLGIPAELLDDPGPVSKEVAALMAISVLDKTPEATVGAAVTGHLGPKAPARLEGLVFAAVARRGQRKANGVIVKRFRCRPTDGRAARQQWVAQQVLELLARELERDR